MEGTVHSSDNQETNRRLEETVAAPTILTPRKLPGTLAILSRRDGVLGMMIVLSIDSEETDSGYAIRSNGRLCETFTRFLPWNGKSASHWQLLWLTDLVNLRLIPRVRVELREDLNNIHITLLSGWKCSECLPLSIFNSRQVCVLKSAFNSPSLYSPSSVLNAIAFCLDLFLGTWDPLSDEIC